LRLTLNGAAMKKNIQIFFLITTLVLVSACGKIKPGNTEEGSSGSIKAVVATAKIASSTGNYVAVGTVRAKTTSTLSGKIMGVVKTVNVREGDSIKTGQTLIVIDERQVSANSSQAKAAAEEAKKAEVAALSAVDGAKAGADLARAAYNRYSKLIADHAVSKQEFDEMEARTRQADAGLKQAEANLDGARQRVQETEAAAASAEVSKKDAVITAPYDGVVASRLVEPGDLASPGTQFLVVEKSGGLEVDVIIPEDRIQTIRQDQELDVSIRDLQEKTLKGTVRAIFPSADPQSRSFTVKVGLPVYDNIRSGVFARVNIPMGDESILAIPSSAVVNQGQLTGTFIIEDDGTARFRLIRTGRKINGSVEVLSGLKDGIRYVVSPPPGLKDGMKVEAAS
jgi:multidrug efflux pump subunit AcrA (membrane-fusion protein)